MDQIIEVLWKNCRIFGDNESDHANLILFVEAEYLDASSKIQSSRAIAEIPLQHLSKTSESISKDLTRFS
jgi:hypothetical protein